MFIFTNKPELYKDLPQSEVIRPIRLNDKVDFVLKSFPNDGFISFRSLYGTAVGRTAWLIGYGPSWSLGSTKKLDGDIFVINRAIRGYPNATYWACHDIDAIPECMDSKGPGTKIITQAGNIYCTTAWPHRDTILIETDRNPERWLLPEKRPLYFNQTTLGWLLDLAVKMGYSRINLLGTDDHTTWEYVSPKFDEKELRRQHVGCRERMLEMFVSDEKQWRDRPVVIADYSNGSLSNLPNIVRGNLEDIPNV